MLNVKCNNIGDYGVQLLSEALINNRVLEHLDIGFNQVTQEGISFLSQVINSTNIKVLNISKNILGNDSIILLSDSFFDYEDCILQKIDFLGCRVGDQGLIYFLDKCLNA
jgi:NLR family CARD domain-containing protein 3